MERLWHHFENANKAAAAHSQAAWEYPLNLATRLHEKLDEEPGRSTVDIVVHKFQHLQKAEDSEDFVAVDNPDVISFMPILASSTYQHGVGTNRYSFKVEYHSRSPSLLGSQLYPSPRLSHNPRRISPPHSRLSHTLPRTISPRRRHHFFNGSDLRCPQS